MYSGEHSDLKGLLVLRLLVFPWPCLCDLLKMVKRNLSMCHVCGKSFTSDKNLSEHLNSEIHSEKNHNSDKCERTFQYKKGLLRHKNTAHEEKSSNVNLVTKYSKEKTI